MCSGTSSRSVQTLHPNPVLAAPTPDQRPPHPQTHPPPHHHPTYPPTPAAPPSGEVDAAHWRALQSLALMALAAGLGGQREALDALRELAGGGSATALPTSEVAAALLPTLLQLQQPPAGTSCRTDQARGGGLLLAIRAGTGRGCTVALQLVVGVKRVAYKCAGIHQHAGIHSRVHPGPPSLFLADFPSPPLAIPPALSLGSGPVCAAAPAAGGAAHKTGRRAAQRQPRLHRSRPAGSGARGAPRSAIPGCSRAGTGPGPGRQCGSGRGSGGHGWITGPCVSCRGRRRHRPAALAAACGAAAGAAQRPAAAAASCCQARVCHPCSCCTAGAPAPPAAVCSPAAAGCRRSATPCSAACRHARAARRAAEHSCRGALVVCGSAASACCAAAAAAARLLPGEGLLQSRQPGPAALCCLQPGCCPA